MNITQKQFLNLMNAIFKEREKYKDISSTLGKYSDGWIVFDNTLEDTIVKFLEDYYNTDLISWWLYEDVEKIVWEDDKEYHLDNLEQLYGYLNEYCIVK